jgi:NAD(P)H dehydrogenase (quinone)
MKKILVLDCHPRAGSLGSALAAAYAEGADGADVRRLALRDLKIDWGRDPGKKPPVELDIATAQAAIGEADHLVFVFPVYWGTFPAQLKGFLDLVFTSGFAFEYQENGFPKGLLAGKSARLIYTSDTPGFLWRWMIGMPAEKTLRMAVLWLCGIRKVKRTMFGPVMKSSASQRAEWLERVRGFGESESRKQHLSLRS